MTRTQEIPWVEKVGFKEEASNSRRRTRLPERLNLYRVPWLRPLIESRWPQFLLRSVTLSGFVFSVAVGLFGVRVGSHNFAIIFVWIAWWTALKLLFIPFGGRSWCSVCPIPLPGEWLQQGGILAPGKRKFGLNLRWPKHLKGSWMQSGSFLLIGLFSALTLTDPKVTGWVLLGIFGMATGLSAVFERRPFCTHFCPIGGFSGMYAQTAPLEVRVVDKEICTKHDVKSCYHACPWGVYPVSFRDNKSCALCMECLRACPNDNLALNLRPFGSDIGRENRTTRLDEAFLALVMLGSVMAFTAVFTGPWGWLKTAAFEIGTTHWIAYAAGYLGLNLLLLPVTFACAVWLKQRISHTRLPIKQAIASQAQVLLPLGLMAWIAFTISFAIPKLNLVLVVLNDPFGWGWNILSLGSSIKMVDISRSSGIIQAAFLLVGLMWATRVEEKILTTGARQTIRSRLPVLVFCLIFTVVMLWLLVG